MAKTAKKPAITAERRSAPLNAPEGFGAPWSERPREGSDRAAARADFDNKPEIRGDTAENAIFEAAARVFGTKSPKVSRAEICAAIKRSLEASGTGAKPFKWPKEGEDIGIEKSWRIFAQNLDQSFSEEEWL